MVKISFGMIVFNTDSTLPKNMLELCIQNVYDYAHEILIVEGATKAITHYPDGRTIDFTDDGRSKDGTISTLKYLAAKYSKIKLLPSKEGFWDGKTEMCNQYAKIATGDYVWQLDSDEFYKKEDMEKLIKLLEEERPDAVHFFANHFIGDFHHCIDERTPQAWGNDMPWMRIFKNSPGNSYWITHEPPNYMCNGFRCNSGRVITREQTLAMGIKMFHYTYITPEQIDFKIKFWGASAMINPMMEKFNKEKDTTDPIIVWHTSKLYKFTGEHPEIIKENYI